MNEHNLRRSNVSEKLTYLINRLKWLISCAEFEEISASSEDIVHWSELIHQLNDLEEVCNSVLPQMVVPFSEDQKDLFNKISEEVSNIVEN